MPSVGSGEALLGVLLGDEHHAFVLRLAGPVFPGQRVVAITDGTLPAAVEMVARPAQIRIRAPIMSVLARNVRVHVGPPEQCRVGVLDTGHHVWIIQLERGQPVLGPLGLVSRMLGEVRAALDVLALRTLHFELRQLVQNACHQRMMTVADEGDQVQRLAQIVGLGLSGIVAIVGRAEIEYPVLDDVQVTSRLETHGHHGPVAIPGLGVDKIVRHRLAVDDIHQQFLVKHAQDARIRVLIERGKVQRLLRSRPSLPLAILFDPDRLLILDDADPPAVGRLDEDAVIGRKNGLDLHRPLT